MSLEEHFESMEKQAHASRLGMWIFVSSESLLFAGLFMLYAGYRIQYPQAFHEGIHHNVLWVGTLNTYIMVFASGLVAFSVLAHRHGRRTLTTLLLWSAALIGVAFVVLKLYEYGKHYADGIQLGGHGHFFVEKQHGAGLAIYFTLYYVLTGAHMVHVGVGILLLLGAGLWVGLGKLPEEESHVLHNVGIYWALVDMVWMFLWPLFYLTSRKI